MAHITTRGKVLTAFGTLALLAVLVNYYSPKRDVEYTPPTPRPLFTSPTTPVVRRGVVPEETSAPTPFSEPVIPMTSPIPDPQDSTHGTASGGFAGGIKPTPVRTN